MKENLFKLIDTFNPKKLSDKVFDLFDTTQHFERIDGKMVETDGHGNPLKPINSSPKVEPLKEEIKKSPYADLAFNNQEYATIGKTSSGKEITIRKSDQYEKAIAAASEATGISKKMLRTVLMKESSMGTIKDSYNPSIGEYAYLTGMTESSKKTLKEKGIKYDLNTPDGNIMATAQFLKLRKTRMDKNEKGELVPFEYQEDPTFYFERYTKPEYAQDPEQVETMNKLLDYYGSY